MCWSPLDIIPVLRVRTAGQALLSWHQELTKRTVVLCLAGGCAARSVFQMRSSLITPSVGYRQPLVQTLHSIYLHMLFQ